MIFFLWGGVKKFTPPYRILTYNAPEYNGHWTGTSQVPTPRTPSGKIVKLGGGGEGVIPPPFLY